MKKISVTTASITMSIGLVVALGGGVAMAHGHGPATGPDHGRGHHGPSGVTVTGTATCNVHGIVVFGADGSVTFRGNVTPFRGAACTTSGGTKLRTGHFSSPLTSATSSTTTTSTSTTTSTTIVTVIGATPTSTTMVCAPVPNGALPDLGNGTITWNPRPKFTPSSGISLTGGSASASTNGHLLIAYTSGSVASGSFASSTASLSLSLTSRQTLAQLQSRCEGGRFVIAVSGTITL